MQPGNWKNMSISMKWGLVSLESLDPNTKEMEGFYKANNFINDIAFGVSLFGFYDLYLNMYFMYPKQPKYFF